MSAPGSDVKLDLDYGTQAWDLLAERLDGFLAAWNAGGDTVKIAEFLPAEPAALRRWVLVELIKVDLEHRWRAGAKPKLLESYLVEFPELGLPSASGEVDLPCDLIYEEFHVRKQLADAQPEATVIRPQDYLERFPRQADEFARLVGIDRGVASTISTAMYTKEKSHEIEPGQTIDDFDLIQKLGRGAFATVYLARQRSMARLVALKISNDRGAEPQILAQLDHPNIIRVFDTRHIPERNLRLLYMQYIPGGALLSVLEHLRTAPAGSLTGKTFVEAIDAALISRGEQPQQNSTIRRKLEHASWAQVVCWLGARLAGALAYAHERGVLHRDIKPANVLVAADGAPKLADFNISFNSKLDGATPAAYFGGSLPYMSPEQLEACDTTNSREPADLDGRSDIYSLGVMLWELWMGVRPFREEEVESSWSRTLGKMVERRQKGITAEMRAALPAGAPPGLEQTLVKCLSADPAQRFAMAAELERELDLCLQPRARKLLQRPESGIRQLPKRYPRAAIIVAGLTPSVILGALNIFYNADQIISHLPKVDRDLFWQQQIAGVNSIAYTVGVGLFFYVNWGVARAVSRLTRGLPIISGRIAWLRERALKMGYLSARLTAALWTISGIVFPVWLHLGAKVPEGMAGDMYGKFLVSQFLCGLMAATLTFFFVTYLAVRVYYPRLAQAEPPAPEETEQLRALSRRVSLYFIATAAAPFLAVLAVAMIGSGQIALGVLGVFGLIASIVSFLLLTIIREDIDALAQAINPAGTSLSASSETSASSWNSTRK